MTVVPVLRSAATWLRHAGPAIKRFFGPFEPEQPGKPVGPNDRVHAPFCVSYGRVVFCLHYPKMRPQSRQDSDGRRSEPPSR